MTELLRKVTVTIEQEDGKSAILTIFRVAGKVRVEEEHEELAILPLDPLVKYDLPLKALRIIVENPLRTPSGIYEIRNLSGEALTSGG
jgi:hypothetical protein